MLAFDQEFTLDPEGWRQTAQLSYLHSRMLGDKTSKPKDWIPTRRPAEAQSDDDMEKLMRAFAKKGKRKKKKKE